MAMTGREINLNPKQFLAHINGLGAKLATGEVAAKVQIGKAGVKDIDRNFKTRSFNNSAWKARSNKYESDGHPLLDDTGAMKKSVSYIINNMWVDIGTPVEYAVFQNSGNPANRYYNRKDGKGNVAPIPARPFIGNSLVFERLVQAILYMMLEHTFSNSKKSSLFR